MNDNLIQIFPDSKLKSIFSDISEHLYLFVYNIQGTSTVLLLTPKLRLIHQIARWRIVTPENASPVLQSPVAAYTPASSALHCTW